MILLIKCLMLISSLLLSFGTCDQSEQLLFVQTIWRHGDRTPTETFHLDINQENAWPQGFGELTEWGMRQHLNLGAKLRARYVDQLKFLSSKYKSDEIYVRSTDVNRTMISAIANMIAMYPGSEDDAGFSYPNITEWPTYQVNGKTVGFVPIPIHTVNDLYDYTLNPDSICPRQDQLWKLVEETPEYQGLTKNKSKLLEDVYRLTQENVTLTNLWTTADALFIEKTWNKTWNEGFTDEIFNEINETNDQVEFWNNGLNLKPYRGIDFAVELPKIRGGSLLWALIDNMQMKINCTLSNNTYDYCSFYGNLKYYAYSAHDTTLAALFSVLGFPYTNWNEEGYPHYSSAISVELWKNYDQTNTVKFYYFPLSNDNLHHDEDEIQVPSCAGLCTIESLKTNFEKFMPTPNATIYGPRNPEALCNTDIHPQDNPAIKTSFTFFNFVIAFVFGICFKICV